MEKMNMTIRLTTEKAAMAASPSPGSAAAAAAAAGCYEDIRAAARAMKSQTVRVYTPVAEHAAVYDALYREYLTLYEYFGRTGQTMQRLRAIRDAGKG